MQLNQQQIQKLSQELKLTPQQILQSTLLQLTTQALEERILKELEENPVLEEDEKAEELQEEEVEEEEQEEIDWDEVLPRNDDFKTRSTYDRSKLEEDNRYDQPSRVGKTEHLFEQLKLLNLDVVDEEIAREIIWNIDDKGYLLTPLDNIAQSLGQDVERVENILKKVQSFNPAGTGARNLRECLLLQLERKENVDDAITIVRDHFDDFANRRFKKILKKLKWDKDRLREAEQEIKELDPKPGLSVTYDASGYITPDLIVREIDGEFIVEINDSRVPELRINSSYVDMVSKNSNVDKEAKSYLKKKINSANWFIQAIYQRRITMIKVMNAIIDRQRQFFEDNDKPLKPMILKDIAEDVDMDISTISRVTNGKYVQLYSGVYELKYFFNEGMQTQDGEEVSTRVIKRKLQKIIDNEDKSKPYSDSKLSEKLKEEGYPVARRTIAKYRKQLNIPVARLRRDI
jgi:RNA polymerase sigma-54 factor